MQILAKNTYLLHDNIEISKKKERKANSHVVNLKDTATMGFNQDGYNLSAVKRMMHRA